MLVCVGAVSAAQDLASQDALRALSLQPNLLAAVYSVAPLTILKTRTTLV